MHSSTQYLEQAQVTVPSPGPSGVVSPSSERALASLFYQRPVEYSIHGTTDYVRQFLGTVRDSFDVELVAPPDEQHGLVQGAPRYARPFVKCIVQAGLAQVRYLFRLATSRGRLRRRRRVLVVGDLYSGPLPCFLALATRWPLVYLCGDPPGRYASSLRKAGFRGATLLALVRRLTETIVLRTSSLVVVRTERMRSQLCADGISAERISVCHHLGTTALNHVPLFGDGEARARESIGSGIGIAFVGNCEYPPNYRAAGYIASRLAPQICRIHPNVKFLLVGLGTERFTRNGGCSVRGLGVVDNLPAVLRSCRVGIAPIEVEGGASVKVINYLVNGLSVVATPQVACTLDLPNHVNVAPLDTFAGKLCQVIESLPSTPPMSTGVEPDQDVRRIYLSSTEWEELGSRMRRLAMTANR